MDARAEAEKRWPIDPKASQFWADINRDQQATFLAGAVYALREFGDLLDVAGSNALKKSKPEVGVPLMGYASEAHRIADGIEEGA